MDRRGAHEVAPVRGLHAGQIGLEEEEERGDLAGDVLVQELDVRRSQPHRPEVEPEHLEAGELGQDLEERNVGAAC